jgi:tRNA-splicing ligase RtcB
LNIKEGFKMIEIQGKYNTAKIFVDKIDDKVKEQIQDLCNQDFTAFSKIRIMPDVHKGAGCTIGTTMTITDKLVPNIVGVDIGCGMETIVLEEKSLDLEALDKFIHGHIPAGENIRKAAHAFACDIDLTELEIAREVDLKRAECSIGTLGSGNHFIEVDKDDAGQLYLVIHSGSRHIGLEVAKYYQRAGYEELLQAGKGAGAKLVAAYKEQGRTSEIGKALAELKKQQKEGISPNLAYVSGATFYKYLHDMKLMQAFAVLNRKAMAADILQALNLHKKEEFTTIHNYIDTENMILRKGAVSARKGERLLIPMNMRDGSLICIGKGNEDWNNSAPHGAGRLMSRSAAFSKLSLEEFKHEMEGIYSTSVSKKTLDESPMAYKDMNEILKFVEPTVEVIKTIKPIYNFKAG